MTLENPKMHSACGLQRPPIRFGGDEVALDGADAWPTGSGNGWRIIVLLFLFAAADCLDGGSEAYKKAKRQAELPDQTTISPDLSVRADCKTRAYAGGFLFEPVEPGVLFRVMNGVESQAGFIRSFI